MTITCQPMDATSGAPSYSAQNERQNMSVLYGGGSGVVLGARSGWRVGTPSNVLTVTSTQWTLAPSSAVINPNAATAQGSYRWSTDTNVTGSVTAPDSTNTRIDIVYIQVNDSSSGDGSGALTAPVSYLAGVPSATPAAPTLPPRSFLVGTITVPKVGGGSPTVVQNTAVFVAAGAPLPVFSVAERDALTKYDGLTVQRRDRPGRPTETWDGSNWVANVRHTEFATPLLNSTAGNGVNFGSMSPSAANTYGNTFCSPGTNGNINFLEEGIYVVTTSVNPPASLGTTQLWAIQNAATTVLSQNGSSYGSNTQTAMFTVHAAVGDAIQFGVTGSNAVSGFGGAVKITKMQGI